MNRVWGQAEIGYSLPWSSRELFSVTRCNTGIDRVQYKENGLRNFTSIVALLVLALGFLQAPFSHMHAGGHLHPADSFFHLHSNGAHTSSVSPAQEEAAIYLDWGATPQTQLEFALPGQAGVLLMPPVETSQRLFVPAPDQLRGPPVLRALPPRAPPV
ncbi:MAG: hypothetical protein NTZ56_13515 [Acidobacteria bacterium]|nr:hypothetical protein [Acidobacteriota bacterium]